MQIPHLAACQPGGLVGCDPGGDHHGLVPCNGIEGQGGGILGHIHDLAEGHQTQLNERLEPVADTQHQTVPLLQQSVHFILDPGVPEECGNELAAAVRLIAAAEAAGQHDNLGLLHLCRNRRNGGFNIRSAQVPDDHHVHVRTGTLEHSCSVVLAVGAREYGNQHPGTGSLDGGTLPGLGYIGIGLDGGKLGLDPAGEHGFQLAFPCLLERLRLHGVALPVDPVIRHGSADDFLSVARLSGQLYDKGAVPGLEQDGVGQLPGEFKADMVAEAHLRNTLGNAASCHAPYGAGTAAVDHALDLVKALLHAVEHRQPVAVILRRNADDRVACLLEFRRDHLPAVGGAHCKGNQGGGHVDVLKGTGHGVLAADGSAAHFQLCPEGAQQCRKGLAPANRVVLGALEIFLEGEPALVVGTAGSHDLGDGLHHRQHRPVVGALFADDRVEAPAHQGAGVGLPLEHRNLCRHSLSGGQLILAAEGHQHRAGADGGVELFHQPLLGAYIQVGHECFPALRGILQHVGDLRGGIRHLYVGILGCPVGIEEVPGQVHDGLAVPDHLQPPVVGHVRNHGSLQVFPARLRQELGQILLGDDHRHTLLGFTDGNFRTVQPVIFLGHSVQIDEQPVGQLPDGNGHAACAEVVAALDHPGNLRIPEQALELPLHRRIALLDLCAAVLQGFQGVGLGGAGSAAAAVPSGLASQQDHHVPGNGGFSADILRRRSADHCADLHALCHIARVIDLGNMAGGKADLVAVGAVAVGCPYRDLTLGQLAGDGILHRHQGICRAGNTHRLVYIGAAGQRIPDGASQTGCRTAEGLDLGGVVVGYVLEHEDPVLFPVFGVHLDLHGACVDLLALVQIRQLAVRLQLPYSYSGHIHQGQRLVVPAQLPADPQVFVIGILNIGRQDLYVLDIGGEGGVPAVIGPVGVDHANLGNGGIPLFRVLEVGLAELDVVQIHGKAVLLDKVPKPGLAELTEARQGLHRGGNFVIAVQAGHQIERGLPALHRVDDVGLEPVKFLVGQVSGDDVYPGIAHPAALFLGENLDALLTGIRTLVKLTRQIFHRKNPLPVGKAGQGVVGHIHRRLGKYSADGQLEILLGNHIGVIAVDDPDGGDVQPQGSADVTEQGLGLNGKLRFFLHIDTENGHRLHL